MTPPTLMQHSNEVFRESSSNRRNLKTPVSGFSLYGKHFENGAFQKQEFSKHKSKMTADNCLFIFLRLGRKTFDAFSEWKRRFKISPAQNERIVWRIADNVSSLQKGVFWNKGLKRHQSIEMRAIATIIVLVECCQITKTANNFKYWVTNC